MKAIRIIGMGVIVFALLMVFTTTSARAQYGYYFNPLLLPFVVAGAAVGTAASIVTGVVPGPYYAYPGYYGPAYYGPAYYGPRYYGGGYYAPARAYYRSGPYRYNHARIHGHHYRHGNWNHRRWR
jgi:hypothetical protein